MVKGKLYEDYAFADYPSGTNAIVAVISYTGYDMEDAMILNKSSYERGMAHGCMYKSMVFNLNENASGSSSGNSKKAKYKMLHTAFTHNKAAKETLKKQVDPNLDDDGIPKMGKIFLSKV
jgi:DNA-directed RNA polymerase I subunit RPA2